MANATMCDVQPFGRGVIHAEGILVDKENFVYGAGRNGRVYRVDPDSNVSEFGMMPQGSIPNGIAMDRKGNLLICDLGLQAVMKVDRSGRTSMVADRVDSVAFTLPNFVTYDAEGNLYVSNSTTRTFHTVMSELANPQPNGSVVRIRPDGRSEIVATGFYFANGTAIDPKEEAIYVLESMRKDCMRVPIRRDGSFGKPEIYSSGFPAMPDGMAFAADGTLFVTLPAFLEDGALSPCDSIIAIDGNGQWTPFLEGPAESRMNFVTNCAFGGDDMQDLYLANLEAEHMSRVRAPVRGHPLYHQR